MARVRLPSFFSQWFLFLCLLWILGQLQRCSAGQIFTDGLSIIDSPQSGSPGHAGSTLSISVEVSGNGKLPSDAADPSCTSPTRFDSLEIYLVSSQTGKNYTVSSGTDFLHKESGSVRHCNWQVPTCIQAGLYNLTFYEYSHINDQPHFTITPISIPIENPRSDSGACTDGLNAYLGQPQQASPPSPPFFQSDQYSQTRTSGWVTSFTTSGSPTATGPVATTTVILTSTGSGGLPTTVTVTQTVPSISISQVVSTITTTSVEGASTATVVQTSTSFVTVTPTGNGLIPVNADCILRTSIVFLLLPLSVAWSLV